MQTDDQTSPADESRTSKVAGKTVETDSKPSGLVKTVLDSVLVGKDAVVVKADSSAQDQEEKADKQSDEAAPENPAK